MTTMNVTEARKDLYNLIDSVHDNHNPLLIKGKRHNAVLLSEDDWLSIKETLYLISKPGMRDSIIDGMKDPLEECQDSIEW